MSQYKVIFENLNWDIPSEGVKNKIFRQGNKQLRLVVFSKDMEPHWCETGHYGYVLEGQMEIEYEAEKVLYQTGDGIFIPPGFEHRHRAKVLTDFIKVIFVEDL